MIQETSNGIHVSYTKEEVAGKSNEQWRQLLIQDAIAFAVDRCDVLPADAVKLAAVFHGAQSPAPLITPELFLCSVDLFTQGLEFAFELGPLTGFVVVPPRNGGAHYKIALAEDRPQHQLVICYKRLGPATREGANFFWSHNVVIPETTEAAPARPGELEVVGDMALCVALTVLSTGDTWDYRPAPIYASEVIDPVTNSRVTLDRLKDLIRPANWTATCANAAQVAGFPFDEARKNIQSYSERQQALQSSRFGTTPLAPAPTPAGSAAAALNGGKEGEFKDVYAGK